MEYTALYYVVAVAGALTLASWFMRLVEWLEHGGRRARRNGGRNRNGKRNKRGGLDKLAAFRFRNGGGFWSDKIYFSVG